jgi:RNA polymerase sigma-70 factor (ECF subfamily)
MPLATPIPKFSAAKAGRPGAPDGHRDKEPRKPGAKARARAWKDDPEVRLMQRVQHGDQDAFAQLQAEYAPRIFGYFCRQLRDRSEAEDLTQEVFLRLYRSRVRYQPRARFATWIFHITQNVARNALRSRRRRPCVPLDTGAPANQGLLEVLSDRADAPSRPLERDELAGVVRAAVAELAGRQRTAVELHQFHDRTYAEVAAELDMTPKAAKSLLYRARNQLREVLQPFMHAGQ